MFIIFGSSDLRSICPSGFLHPISEAVWNLSLDSYVDGLCGEDVHPSGRLVRPSGGLVRTTSVSRISNMGRTPLVSRGLFHVNTSLVQYRAELLHVWPPHTKQNSGWCLIKVLPGSCCRGCPATSLYKCKRYLLVLGYVPLGQHLYELKPALPS